MEYAIVYSSRTGNTKMLAETVKAALPENACVYFGNPDDAALQAKRIYVGFWTDKGTCDEETAEFLKKVTNQELFLFGTAGFGDDAKYFDKVLDRTEKHLQKDVTVIGRFMCRGKMPMSVRKKYEDMQQRKLPVPHIQELIANFDKALTHPDANDLAALKKALQM